MQGALVVALVVVAGVLTALPPAAAVLQRLQPDPHHIPGFDSGFLPIDVQQPAKRAPLRPTTPQQQQQQQQQPRLAGEEGEGEGSERMVAYNRLQQRLHNLIALQGKTTTTPSDQHSEGADEHAAQCACSDNFLSGETMVPFRGCGLHDGPESTTAYCYVAQPSHCVEFSRPSNLYDGARWRFCDAPDGTQGSDNDHTHIDHSTENGYHTITMQHSGVKTTLVTEGNATLSPERARRRSAEIVNQVKEDQALERRNLTQAINTTQEATRKALATAYSTIGEGLDGMMTAIDSALNEALRDPSAASPNNNNNPPPSFDAMYHRIHSKLMARTKQLRPPPLDDKGNVMGGHNRTETLFDRMMKMSDRIVANVDAKMRDVSRHVADQAAHASSPVTVSAVTDN